MTISSAHRAILRRRRSITIFDPSRRFFDRRTAAFDVDRDRRFSAGSTRERHKLISAKVARLRLIFPRQIGPCDALVARPDAPQPAIVLRDVATGPTNKSGIELFDLFENVATHTTGRSVTGHQRNLINPDRAFAGKQDRETCKWITANRLQGELILTPVAFRDVHVSRSVD